MKTIVIYSESDLGRDPRVARQIECLCTEYRVVAMGTAPPRTAVHRFIRMDQSGIDASWGGRLSQIRALIGRRGIGAATAYLLGWLCARVPQLFPVKRFLDFAVTRRRAISRLAAARPDLVIANDLTALPVAWAAVGRKVPILFDAHEYYPGQFPRIRRTYPRRAYASYLLSRYAKRALVVTTIGPEIAKLYARNYGIDPLVLTNAPEYIEQGPSAMSREKIRLVHHGLASRGRSLETMIEAVLLLGERFELHLYLMESDKGYVEKLRLRSDGNKRIHFHEAVPMSDIPREINRYDIGLYILPPSCVNQAYALPNKIFEFVQGRLGVAVGPSVEMASLVRRHSLGLVARDFSAGAMAEALRGLDEATVARFKANAHLSARELSSATNMEKLRSIVASLIGS